MADEFIDRMRQNAEVLSGLSNEDVLMLALSELMSEMALGKEMPPGTKAKRIALSADLARRAGVKW